MARPRLRQARALRPCRPSRPSARICARSASRSNGNAEISGQDWPGRLGPPDLRGSSRPRSRDRLLRAPRRPTRRAASTLSYKGRDDYGIASTMAWSNARRQRDRPHARASRPRSPSPFPTTRTTLPRPSPSSTCPPIPGPARGSGSALRVKDEAGQEALSEIDRLHPAATQFRQSPRQGACRTAARYRAGPRRSQACPDRPRCPVDRARSLHAAMGRVHGAALRAPPASQGTYATRLWSKWRIGSGRWRSRSRTAIFPTAEQQLRAAQDRLKEAMDRARPTRRSSV